MKKISKTLLLVLSLTLLFTFVSCKEEKVQDDLWSEAIYLEDVVLGDGEKTITVEVSAGDKTITLTINTNAETLGEALIENALVEGDETQFGLYIKKVNNILADYDVDGYYWSLSKMGEYLMTGADTTPISDGEHYEFIRTK